MIPSKIDYFLGLKKFCDLQYKWLDILKKIRFQLILKKKEKAHLVFYKWFKWRFDDSRIIPHPPSQRLKKKLSNLINFINRNQLHLIWNYESYDFAKYNRIIIREITKVKFRKRIIRWSRTYILKNGFFYDYFEKIGQYTSKRIKKPSVYVSYVPQLIKIKGHGKIIKTSEGEIQIERVKKPAIIDIDWEIDCEKLKKKVNCEELIKKFEDKENLKRLIEKYELSEKYNLDNLTDKSLREIALSIADDIIVKHSYLMENNEYNNMGNEISYEYKKALKRLDYLSLEEKKELADRISSSIESKYRKEKERKKEWVGCIPQEKKKKIVI